MGDVSERDRSLGDLSLSDTSPSHTLMYRAGRFLIGIISIAAFLGALLVVTIPLKRGSPGQFALDLSARLLIFDIVILFIWLAAGVSAGVLAAGAYSLFIIYLAVNKGLPLLNLQVILILISSAIIYLFTRRANVPYYSFIAQSDQIEAKTNLLRAEFHRHKLQTPALQKRSRRYSRLKGLTEALGSLLSRDEVAHFIVDSTFDIVGKSQRCLLYLIDPVNQELGLNASKQLQGGGHIKEKRGDAFETWVLRHRQPLIVGDVKKDFRFSASDEAMEVCRALISAPLTSEERLMGLLRLDSEQPANYTPDDLRLLDIVASLAAVGLRNAELYERTKELALRDGLTGLFVQRHFKERLDEELKRAARTNTSCGLLMIDIDHFKDYNDHYGHVAGDVVLREIARMVSGAVSRTGDIAARYGGEEFAVILPQRSKETASSVAEALRREVQSHIFQLRRKETHLTMSIGVVAFPSDGKDREELLRSADIALYQAKRAGRNRVETL